ncbi:unnamed protein product, partial [Prorocentrum cordatum]
MGANVGHVKRRLLAPVRGGSRPELREQELGWAHGPPDVWIGDRGGGWRRKGDWGDDCSEFSGALRSPARGGLRRRAGGRLAGAGVAEGGDARVLRINLRWLRRRGRRREAGALESNALASIRAEARAEAAGHKCEDDCPGCERAQEPDTACGKGFDELVQGSKDYFATASVELFTHPGKLTDNATFATEFQCWFAHMVTQSCSGLPSQAATRKRPLTEACTSVTEDAMVIWKMFSKEEVDYFKTEYPAK